MISGKISSRERLGRYALLVGILAGVAIMNIMACERRTPEKIPDASPAASQAAPDRSKSGVGKILP